jgi:two-component system OmpR family sensor kinase
MPIRLRLAALAAIGALVLSSFGGWVFLHQLRQGLHASADSSLRTRADALVLKVRDAQGGIDFQDSGSTKLLPANEAIAQVISPSGRVVESSEAAGRAALLPATRSTAARRGTVYFEGGLAGSTERVRFLATPVVRADGRWIVIVGSSLESADNAVARVRTGLLLAGALTTLAAAVGAWLLATFALRPVERMRRQAAAISEHDDDTRLAVPRTHDEIAVLGDTMNELLARLQCALAQQRAFVADAGHELRTPLAILRTELELAARPGRSIEDLRHAIVEASVETDRLGRLAEELLFLARHDELGARSPRELQPLRPLLDRAADSARVRAAAQAIDVVLDASPELAAPVAADDLRRAVDNLVDNALHHAPSGSTVKLAVRRVGPQIEISVSDRGPGFPPLFLPHAFERFRRADPARVRDDLGGSGLGLAIVRAVARDHGGDAEAHNRQSGGARVLLRVATSPD